MKISALTIFLFMALAGGPALAQESDDLALVVTDPDLGTFEETPPPPPGGGEIDPSAPGMTGVSAGTIPIMMVEAAYLAHRRGDFKAAIAGYTGIIRRRGLTKKERAVTYVLRGEAKRDDGQLVEAILDFTRALRQWPGYPAAHHFRGRVYDQLDQLTPAYADLAMAAYLDPAREAYQTSLAFLKLRLREAGLLKDNQAPPRPVEPRLPEDK